MNHDLSISDLLAKAGYRHARTPNSNNTGEHTIKDSYGNVVGHMCAHRAVQFLALGFLGYGAA